MLKSWKIEGFRYSYSFGMSDKYNSAKVIGTSQEFLDGYVLEKGAMFEDSFEVVVV